MQTPSITPGLEQSIHEIKESLSRFANVPNNSALSDKLLSEKEVARLINMSLSFLQHDRQRGGGIPFIKIGATVRYRKSDVDAYLSRQSRLHTADNGGHCE